MFIISKDHERNWVSFLVLRQTFCNLLLSGGSGMVIKWRCVRAESRLEFSQWETSLHSNTVSHWLGANLESALIQYITNYFECIIQSLQMHIAHPWYKSWHIRACMVTHICRAEFRFGRSQWGTALLCNDVSRWLGASLESALYILQRRRSSEFRVKACRLFVMGQFVFME